MMGVWRWGPQSSVLTEEIETRKGRALPKFPSDVWIEVSGYIGWKVDASVRSEIVCLRVYRYGYFSKGKDHSFHRISKVW